MLQAAQDAYMVGGVKVLGLSPHAMMFWEQGSTKKDTKCMDERMAPVCDSPWLCHNFSQGVGPS